MLQNSTGVTAFATQQKVSCHAELVISGYNDYIMFFFIFMSCLQGTLTIP